MQKGEDLHVNYARHETNVPEVTLPIVIKHLTGRKRLALRTFGGGDKETPPPLMATQ